MRGLEQETDVRDFVSGLKRGTVSHKGTLVLILTAILYPICLGNPIVLNDVTRETGITFVHTDGSSGERYILETITAGLALFDYDNDGDIDIIGANHAGDYHPVEMWENKL